MSNSAYQEFIPDHPKGLQVENSDVTPSDILGPFYRPGSPFRRVLCSDPDLTIRGKVSFTDGTTPDNAYIEFWQADAEGKYDVKGPHRRGIQALNDDGTYEVWTTRPGFYDISDPADPEPHDFRCAHIHVKVWVNGRDVLTTQLYFKDDKYNDTDHWFDTRRVIQFDGKTGTFDFVIKK